MDKGTHAPTDVSRYNPGEMISFVVPLYVGNTTIGAVGMDIDFDAVKDMGMPPGSMTPDTPFSQMTRQMSRGIAVYEEHVDLTVSDVFKRADEAMYQNKMMMKERKQAEDSPSA